jgi:hypothetical protein
MSQRASDLDGFFGSTTYANENDMRIASWYVRSLYEYRAGSLMTVAKEI